ncbi:hypothetical protein [Microbispora sp. CA-102843]|uniref:hypothetical protein n=1 Tax=Microbispora sp. CA-102843 TaxID=3239952 RepID=UPI003D8F71A4
MAEQDLPEPDGDRAQRLLPVRRQLGDDLQGASTLGAGLRLLPLVGGLTAGALSAGVVVRALGAKATVVVGFVLLGAGSLIGMATSADSTTTFVSVWMAVLCAGSGLAFTAATTASVSRLTEERSGIGAAVVQAFQKTAGPLGTAVMGSVLAAAYTSRLDLSGLTPASAAAAGRSVSGGIDVADQIRSASFAHAVRGAFVHGMNASLLVSAAIAAAGLVLALAFLPGAPALTRTQTGRSRDAESTHRSGTDRMRPTTSNPPNPYQHHRRRDERPERRPPAGPAHPARSGLPVRPASRVGALPRLRAARPGHAQTR